MASNPVPEIIDPVFTKTSQNARFLLSENERFGLVFVKTGSINSGTDISSKYIMDDISKGVANTLQPAKKIYKKTLSYEMVACELSRHLQIELPDSI